MDAHKTQIKNTKMNELNGWNCTLFWLAQKLIKVIMAENPKSQIQNTNIYKIFGLCTKHNITYSPYLSTINYHSPSHRRTGY